MFRLPSRPLLNAAVMPMLLSKELSSSSDGCGFVFSWYSVQQCGNYWHGAKDPMCLLQGQMMMFIFRVENHPSPVAYISVQGGILSCSVIFLVQVWQWRILTIKMETLCVKSNIINFYNFVIQIFLTKETWSLCYLAIFFGFYLHYLHSKNEIWFPLGFISSKAFFTFLF